MGSKKRAAWSKAKSEFLGAATGGDMSDLFAREDERRGALDAERDEAWRYKSCERKNRYDTRAEAEAVMADCENRGRRGLACYKCEYCGGWHLTSHPWKEAPHRRDASHCVRAMDAAAPKRRSERPYPQVDSSALRRQAAAPSPVA